MEARVRAAEGRGGGKCRTRCEHRSEVGLERWTGGRVGGIELVWLVAPSSVRISGSIFGSR